MALCFERSADRPNFGFLSAKIFRQLPRCGAGHVVRLPSTPMKSRLVTAAIIVVGITAVVSAQTPSVEVIWARQPDTPLRVVRIRSTLTNPIREIAVKNASKVDINSYQLGWVPVVPPGCGTPIKASVRLLPSVEGPVWPSVRWGRWRLHSPLWEQRFPSH